MASERKKSKKILKKICGIRKSTYLCSPFWREIKFIENIERLVQASTEKSKKNDRSRASIPEGIKTSVRTA